MTAPFDDNPDSDLDQFDDGFSDCGQDNDHGHSDTIDDPWKYLESDARNGGSSDDGSSGDEPRVSVILPAAGESSRMGLQVRKPFLQLGGITILERTCRRMRETKLVDEIILAVHPDDLDNAQGKDWPTLEKAGVTMVVAGGVNRAESVWNALQVSDPTADVVAVHDAVRPFVSVSLCRALFKLAEKRGAAIPANPVSDTIKRIEGDTILETIQRVGLMSVQTPQAFRRSVLLDAFDFVHSTGGLSERITDDASMVEAYGLEVAVIHGEPYNLKITTRDDLKLAEMLLGSNLVS